MEAEQQNGEYGGNEEHVENGLSIVSMDSSGAKRGRDPESQNGERKRRCGESRELCSRRACIRYVDILRYMDDAFKFDAGVFYQAAACLAKRMGKVLDIGTVVGVGMVSEKWMLHSCLYSASSSHIFVWSEKDGVQMKHMISSRRVSREDAESGIEWSLVDWIECIRIRDVLRRAALLCALRLDCAHPGIYQIWKECILPSVLMGCERKGRATSGPLIQQKKLRD